MDCLRDRDKLHPPIPVTKENSAAQAADLYAYAVFQSCLLRGPSECFSFFMEKLHSPRERIDTRTFRSELAAYLASATSTVHSEAYPEGVRVPIPKRSETTEAQFNFAGNKKKIRRATVGIKK